MADHTYDASKSGEIDKFNINLGTRLRNFKNEFASEFLDRVRARTPVLSGALQNGWGYDMKQQSINVWNTKDYAGFVEYGTPKVAPVGMLRTTVLEAEQIAEIAKQRSEK